MFDFTEMLKPQVDALKPHLTTAHELFTEVRDILGDIRENTADKPFTPDRDRLWRAFQCTSVAPAGIAATSYAEVTTVPATEDWELESLRVGATGAGVLHLYDSNGKATGDAALIAASYGDVTSANGIVSGNGVVVPGGTVIWALATPTAGQTVNGVLQVRRRRRVPAHPGYGGDMLPGPSGDSETPHAEASRHVGTWATART